MCVGNYCVDWRACSASYISSFLFELILLRADSDIFPTFCIFNLSRPKYSFKYMFCKHIHHATQQFTKSESVHVDPRLRGLSVISCKLFRLQACKAKGLSTFARPWKLGFIRASSKWHFFIWFQNLIFSLVQTTCSCNHLFSWNRSDMIHFYGAWYMGNRYLFKSLVAQMVEKSLLGWPYPPETDGLWSSVFCRIREADAWL